MNTLKEHTSLINTLYVDLQNLIKQALTTKYHRLYGMIGNMFLFYDSTIIEFTRILHI